jgi:hypothetical protein
MDIPAGAVEPAFHSGCYSTSRRQRHRQHGRDLVHTAPAIPSAPPGRRQTSQAGPPRATTPPGQRGLAGRAPGDPAAPARATPPPSPVSPRPRRVRSCARSQAGSVRVARCGRPVSRPRHQRAHTHTLTRSHAHTHARTLAHALPRSRRRENRVEATVAGQPAIAPLRAPTCHRFVRSPPCPGPEPGRQPTPALSRTAAHPAGWLRSADRAFAPLRARGRAWRCGTSGGRGRGQDGGGRWRRGRTVRT